MHQLIKNTRQPSTRPAVAFGGALRLLTVAQFWADYDEPIELLTDASVTFATDTAALVSICERDKIVCRSERENGEPVFPVWLLREFYPRNP